MIKRRTLLSGSIFAATGFGLALNASPATADEVAQLQLLESGEARLGVCLLDTATGTVAGHRLDEHFAMCSTFKLALIGAYLREADAGRINLNEVIPVAQSDLLEWSPITSTYVDKGGMTIRALAQAAQTMSDGTAANLLVRRLGGPAAVTAKFREMGDPVTRLDRYEPALGMVLSADLRDTTTPQAMAQLVQRLTTGNLLAPATRQILLQWMFETKTGMRRLRAGLPQQWQVGDKTGTGRAAGTTNKCNDIAIVFPPHRPPVIIAAYYDSGEFTEKVEDRHQAVLAEVGKIAASWINRLASRA
jgi:beta-lactamase class A